LTSFKEERNVGNPQLGKQTVQRSLNKIIILSWWIFSSVYSFNSILVRRDWNLWL